MSNKLSILVCEDLSGELKAVVEQEFFKDVIVYTFTGNCARPNTVKGTLSSLIEKSKKESNQILLIGGCCISHLKINSDTLKKDSILTLNGCFELFIAKETVNSYIKNGAYLLTPGWLMKWKKRISDWGFTESLAKEFFSDSAKYLLLLDTGIDSKANAYIKEFSDFVGLSYETLPVGLDNLRMKLMNIILEWRLNNEKNKTISVLNNANKRLADNLIVFDLLSSLPDIKDEVKAIERIFELFIMICAPQKIVYIFMNNEQIDEKIICYPKDLVTDEETKVNLMNFNDRYSWLESGNGFILKITHQAQTLGILELEGFSFPEYKQHYFNLAITIAQVCGLAISNARAYQEIVIMVEKLNRSVKEYMIADKEIKKLNEDLKHRANELETVNKELESFSYTVSHDLRNPLNIIKGFSKIILEDYSDKLDNEGNNFIKNISTTALRMEHIINDILKLSQITKGEIHCMEINLSIIAESVAQGLQTLHPERKIGFIIADEITVKADEGLIKVVLDNLIGNAWKYSRKTENAIIEFGVTQIDGKTTYFIKDNGAGFDMKYADKLFVPFKRLHSSSEFEGIGIGLATVQRIINRHGGNIWAESEVNKGTTFFFTLE